MPYITEERRGPIDAWIQTSPAIDDAGDLNYSITKQLQKFTTLKGKRYLTICIVMGTLICVAFEYYRRLAAPYEDQKIKENGDVY